MAFAAILIHGMVVLSLAGETGGVQAAAAVVAPGDFAILAAWSAATEPRPVGDTGASFVFEDEDDTLDDVPLDSAVGFHAADLLLASAHPLFGHAPRRVASRSASPTLRLRC